MTADLIHKKARQETAFSTNRAYRTDGIDVAALKPAAEDGVQLRLHGVDHTARPTWKLRETVTFYRDILGLPLIHTISARGWGQPGHPDFLHFFFDAGNGATIAFFYYIGTERPEKYLSEDHYFYAATHTAWGVENRQELERWKETLEARGIAVSPYTQHEGIESIYFLDPNGYPLEVTLRLRDVERIDARDAELTLRAAIDLEDAARASGTRMTDIDAVWRRKAALVDAWLEDA
ncbi:VOC family protein [Tistrella bauzanensis]|uniref:VOC family protein n=1 Tax=Tistrella arctica TaxID=3133430 RepID=A0ABU9YPG5_9PROT